MHIIVHVLNVLLLNIILDIGHKRDQTHGI